MGYFDWACNLGEPMRDFDGWTLVVLIHGNESGIGKFPNRGTALDS